MTLYAIDPGTEQSALVVLYPDGIVGGCILQNNEMRSALLGHVVVSPCHLVVEQIENMGMPAGKSLFETVFWSGRFVEAWQSHGIEASWSMLPRRQVKLAICGSMRAKDANIRRALLDRYGGDAAGKRGGPLAGIKSHLWAALAVGVAYQEMQQQERIA